MAKVLDKTTYAIIATGGKQYKVSPDSVINIECLKGNLEKGSKVSFDQVLLKDDGSKVIVGNPFIDKASVKAEILEIGRGDKITVIRYRAKSRHFKKRGHRQPFMKVKILSI